MPDAHRPARFPACPKLGYYAILLQEKALLPDILPPQPRRLPEIDNCSTCYIFLRVCVDGHKTFPV